MPGPETGGEQGTRDGGAEPDVRVIGLGEHPDRAAALARVEEIFFAASATRDFAGPEARAAFLERWLGRYLAHVPAATRIAVVADGGVLGYIVGSARDPATDPLFADIAYFRDLAPLTAGLPAHLHINLAAEARNRGIGGRLIAAFAAWAREEGARGMHVVTAKASANRSFYARQGFTLRATLGEAGREIVMLGRPI